MRDKEQKMKPAEFYNTVLEHCFSSTGERDGCHHKLSCVPDWACSCRLPVYQRHFSPWHIQSEPVNIDLTPPLTNARPRHQTTQANQHFSHLLSDVACVMLLWWAGRRGF